MAKTKPWYKDWSMTRHPVSSENSGRIIIRLPNSEFYREIVINTAGIETVTVVNLLEAALLELSKKTK